MPSISPRKKHDRHDFNRVTNIIPVRDIQYRTGNRIYASPYVLYIYIYFYRMLVAIE